MRRERVEEKREERGGMEESGEENRAGERKEQRGKVKEEEEEEEGRAESRGGMILNLISHFILCELEVYSGFALPLYYNISF